ncbi:hypothetical protein [Puniceibacterium sp. IMCC21224]|uniref:hypothetical protein n=1 Tax=Puniceibacterium sp. IMCC21224 TaxID=1618204 RepID=UPI00064E02B7|nr:hypothetical protein [Puniceibacterium sp. IMCC21224]KMK66321.1 hypothetical protein IMCC21224_111171 [Puniceibacterium sp. IMCC21224]
MTALNEYQRLEATGLWRPTPDAQRREVVVSLGDATLTISDTSDRVLAHWSLAAVARLNKGQRPAIFHPDGDSGETLELDDAESVMIDGIEKVRRVIDRRRPRPGKLRFVATGGFALAIAGLALFWLPNALLQHTVKVVPMVKRDEIGLALQDRISRVAGQPCAAAEAVVPLRHLASRILGEQRSNDLVVLREGVRRAAHLPGGIILLNRALVEDPEDPDVTAGYVLVEAVRASRRDPLEGLLRHAGLLASLQLLTTGVLPDAALDQYAEALLTAEPQPLSPDILIPAFAAAELRTTPYAYAEDITGESTLPLIEADPRAVEGSSAVLSDADWVRLQGICGA